MKKPAKKIQIQVQTKASAPEEVSKTEMPNNLTVAEGLEWLDDVYGGNQGYDGADRVHAGSCNW